MSAGFTPGPWAVDVIPNESMAGVHWRQITADNGLLILAEAYHDEAENEPFITDDIAHANAHLIAAAPALYEALDSVHKLIAEGAEHGFNSLVGDWAERLFTSQQRTFPALAKARGES
jgi:hypothetical protein